MKTSLFYFIVAVIFLGSIHFKEVPEKTKVLPIITRISVLSIHIRDTLIHDSVFHFLKDKLGLSVEYYPLKYAERKYAGVYAGNLFLEPCGPYSNFTYASNQFKAIFFGLNCESERTLSSLAEDIASRNIDFVKNGSIQINDTAFIRQNIFLGISTANESNIKREDSLRAEMLKRNENSLTIERIKEIRIGYAGETALKKWKKLIEPSEITRDGIWKINESQSARFIESNINEVTGIVFKVKSLQKARIWLMKNNLAGAICEDEIELDKAKTFGLSIVLGE